MQKQGQQLLAVISTKMVAGRTLQSYLVVERTRMDDPENLDQIRFHPMAALAGGGGHGDRPGDSWHGGGGGGDDPHEPDDPDDCPDEFEHIIEEHQPPGEPEDLATILLDTVGAGPTASLTWITIPTEGPR